MAEPVFIFCSVNRPEMLHESVLSAVKQTILGPILISVPGREHVLPETLALPQATLIISPRGLPAQRNAALNAIKNPDTVIFFFDDDVEIEEHYAERMLMAYACNPNVALMNGTNIARGARPGSLTRQSARELIAQAIASLPPAASLERSRTAYGCRMSFPGHLLGKVSFDERLALYGYLEDSEFSLKCERFGKIVTNKLAIMAHIETAAGRVGVFRRGYSEIVNPVYIAWKHRNGNKLRAYCGAFRRTIRNGLKLHQPAARKQLAGNLLGWGNVASGQLTPERVTELRD